MLSEAKHLSAHRDRPFASLRVTNHSRSCLLNFIITCYKAQGPTIFVYLSKYTRGRRRLLMKHGGPLKPNDVRDMLAYINEHRSSTTAFDIVKISSTPGDDTMKGEKMVTPFAEVGVTWWLESLYAHRNSFEEMRLRIRQGPPRLP